MKRLLHIIATPRKSESRTLMVTAVFLEAFKDKYPECEIDSLDLYSESLPELTSNKVAEKYTLMGGKDLSDSGQASWQKILEHIVRFKEADTYLISTPMWNFSIPYKLKHYIDIIVQPRYLFQYTSDGVEGLVKNKKMTVITARGGDYSTPEMSAMDQQEPYLRIVFGLVGLEDITFVNAQPMDALGPEVLAQKIKDAREAAKKAAENI